MCNKNMLVAKNFKIRGFLAADTSVAVTFIGSNLKGSKLFLGVGGRPPVVFQNNVPFSHCLLLPFQDMLRAGLISPVNSMQIFQM